MPNERTLRELLRAAPKPRIWKWRYDPLAPWRVGWVVQFPTGRETYLSCDSWQEALSVVAEWYEDLRTISRTSVRD